MTNRTLGLLTALLSLSMIIFTLLNLATIATTQNSRHNFLKHNDVRAIAVSYNHKLYTLNFKQQNTLIDIINSATLVPRIPQQSGLSIFDKLVIYQFQNKPEIVLSIEASSDQNLIFSSSGWAPQFYLMEKSNGKLQKLLHQACD